MPVVSSEDVPSGAGRPGIAEHVQDGPGPFGIYPWLLVGVGAVADVLHGRARPVWASAPLLAVFVVSIRPARRADRGRVRARRLVRARHAHAVPAGRDGVRRRGALDQAPVADDRRGPAVGDGGADRPAARLTARERDVLAAAVDGSTIADIAGRLHLSESTVRNYLSAAIGKTAARNRIEAVRAARRNGWV
jgi:DNA-binding CsgD family transcriptional regulator